MGNAQGWLISQVFELGKFREGLGGRSCDTIPISKFNIVLPELRNYAGKGSPICTIRQVISTTLVNLFRHDGGA
jgi:hypothetical protein